MGFQDKGVESRVEQPWDVIRLPWDSSSRRVVMSDKPREFSIFPEDWEDIRELVEKLENVEVGGRSTLDKFEQLEKRLDSVVSGKGLSLEFWVRICEGNIIAELIPSSGWT